MAAMDEFLMGGFVDEIADFSADSSTTG